MAGLLAAVPTGSAVSPCCCLCSQNIPELDVTVAGVVGCCGTLHGGGDQDFLVIFPAGVVNGNWVVPQVSPGVAWALNDLGTAVLQLFPSGDGTCTGDPVEFDLATSIQIACLTDEEGNTFIAIGILASGSGFNFVVFRDDNAAMNSANPNENTICDIETGSDPNCSVTGTVLFEIP